MKSFVSQYPFQVLSCNSKEVHQESVLLHHSEPYNSKVLEFCSYWSEFPHGDLREYNHKNHPEPQIFNER
jgi:hypothetical protein